MNLAFVLGYAMDLSQADPKTGRGPSVGLACHLCSGVAAASLFGPDWKSDPRSQVLPYGIDLRPFAAAGDRAALAAVLGIPASAKVIGHVGRFLGPGGGSPCRHIGPFD